MKNQIAILFCTVVSLCTAFAFGADEPISKDRKELQDEARAAFEKASAANWQQVFFDAGTGDWKERWFLDGEVGKVETGAKGMELTAGPEFNNDAHHMVLWTRDSFAGDLEIEYDYTRLDQETRCVNILYIQATGSGKEPFDKDISKWTQLRRVPAMRMYYDHMHAYHISYAAFPNNKDTTGYIRARRYLPDASGLRGTDLKPDYYPEGLFEPGVPHKITVIKKASDLFMRIENAEQVYYCHMTNAEFPPIHRGRVGLRHMFTRSARYKNIRISTVGHDTPALDPSLNTEAGAVPAPIGAQHGWPPAPMEDLPTDYQQRQRRALEAQLESISKLRPEANPVLWVRFSIAGLALDRYVDRIKAYIEDDGFEYQPSDKFGFSLFSLPYVRLYALFNDHTGVMKGRLSLQAQANLEKTLWDCAKANSKLAEAGRDVWDMDGSENHHVASKVSDFLVAQYLKDIPAYADLKYDDGSTAQQQYEARLAYWHRWIDSRVRCGLFMEDGGSSYQNYTIEALLNLRDFVDNDVLRRKADMFLDLVFANIAEETLGVQRSGPKTRTKEEEFRSRAYDLLFDSPGDRFELSNYQLSTSDYYPPPAIVELAKDFKSRGVYSFAKLAPGAVAPGTTENKTTPELVPGSKWRKMDKDNLMVRHGFATAHYIIGSHALDTAAKVDPYRAQRWQGIVFANDPMARIGMDGKSGETKGGYISNPFKTIQDRNVMVTMRWGPVIDPKTDPCLWIYFSSALDVVEEDGGWIFVKSGHAYAAIRIVGGGYTWSKPWTHRASLDAKEKAYVTPDSQDAAIISVANDAADYGDDFASFQRALIAEPIVWKDGVLKFAGVIHEGSLKPGRISGQTVNLRPLRVNDSPFIRSDLRSGVVFIRKGEATLKLDFSDPNNPKRIVGGPATSEDPLGAGAAMPIVFEVAQ